MSGWPRLAALLVACTAAPAGAAPAREGVVVLPIAVRGELDDHVVRALEGRVADGLRRDFAVVPADEVRARAPVGDCGPACLRELAGPARYLVRGRVAVEGRDFELELELLRADTGAAVVTSSDLCEICGHDELEDRAGDLASALRRKLGAAVEPPPRLRVLARPHGSAVVVDGAVVGVTPLDITVAGGEHEVAVRREGFVEHRRRLAFAEGRTETIDVELGPVPPPPARQRRLAPSGWAALAVGAAAAGGGVALIALDERPIRRDCAGDDVDADGDCRWRHDTLAGGVTLVVAGVAALAVGAALVAVDRRRGRARATVWTHPSGLGVRF